MIGDRVTNQRTGNETTKAHFVGSWFRSNLRRFVTKRGARGFTLMEMLVSLGLFAIVITIATDLFLSFQRASRKTERLETMVANARLTLERIASGVKEGSIEYARYQEEGIDLTVNSPQRRLYILNTNQESVRFTYADCSAVVEGLDCIQLVGPTGSESITSEQLRVRDVQFFIHPAGDPALFVTTEGAERQGQYAADAQTRVTVMLSFDAGSPDDPQYVRYDVQTTISSRAYVR